MAARRTARKAKQTERFGVDVEEGQDVNAPVTGASTTALKKGKTKALINKPAKRQRYSEEAESYDDSTSDTDDSRQMITFIYNLINIDNLININFTSNNI